MRPSTLCASVCLLCFRISCLPALVRLLFFFFNDPATTEIYTLSLHDALPICRLWGFDPDTKFPVLIITQDETGHRSEEHTSELQSLRHLVCRLLLEKKKRKGFIAHPRTIRRGRAGSG